MSVTDTQNHYPPRPADSKGDILLHFNCPSGEYDE